MKIEILFHYIFQEKSLDDILKAEGKEEQLMLCVPSLLGTLVNVLCSHSPCILALPMLLWGKEIMSLIVLFPMNLGMIQQLLLQLLQAWEEV